jgi:hypothetical protein
MIAKKVVYVEDLFKKHKDKESYKGIDSTGKNVYQDDVEVLNENTALDKKDLEIPDKIMSI